MINEHELAKYVEQEIPELSFTIASHNCLTVHDTINLLRNHTHDNIEEQNFGAVKKCMIVAENLYKKGNRVIKNAVENVFVYSFSGMLFHDTDKRRMLRSLIPVSLYSVYIHQVLHSHI